MLSQRPWLSWRESIPATAEPGRCNAVLGVRSRSANGLAQTGSNRITSCLPTIPPEAAATISDFSASVCRPTVRNW
jgi:hypothetical protein